MERRAFLEFIGKTAVVSTLIQSPISLLAEAKENFPFKPLPLNIQTDNVELIKGLSYEVFVKWGDKLNQGQEKFGFNNDYIAILPNGGDPHKAIMWVNHEYPSELFVSGGRTHGMKGLQAIIKEMDAVGGSIIAIEKNTLSGDWEIDLNNTLNQRITAKTRISFDNDFEIQGSNYALGTMANCAGGVTPWNTFLSCEENYDEYYGEVAYINGKREKIKKSYYEWDVYFNSPPEHYGWVVEINPFTGKAIKRIRMGRFAHESATVAQRKDKRIAVYMGDDKNGECVYKFIPDNSNSLESGKLYVANIDSGKWELLDYREPKLKQFESQLELLIQTRVAAHLVGGTAMDRPEDIVYDKNQGAAYIALSNNKLANNYFGSILKIQEENGDPLAMNFTASTFISGGETPGFACPDNLEFDKAGNLWIATDISGASIGKPPYSNLGNNGLFVIPRKGKFAGIPFKIATAPTDAEFTGICFAPDNKSLFLSVQHPGEGSRSLKKLSSHWPEGGENIPRPAVINIKGKKLEKILNGEMFE